MIRVEEIGQLLTAAEVAEMTGIGQGRVREDASAGRLRGLRVPGKGRGGRQWRFTASAVAEYLSTFEVVVVDSPPVVVDDGRARRRTRGSGQRIAS